MEDCPEPWTSIFVCYQCLSVLSHLHSAWMSTTLSSLRRDCSNPPHCVPRSCQLVSGASVCQPFRTPSPTGSIQVVMLHPPWTTCESRTSDLGRTITDKSITFWIDLCLGTEDKQLPQWNTSTEISIKVFHSQGQRTHFLLFSFQFIFLILHSCMLWQYPSSESGRGSWITESSDGDQICNAKVHAPNKDGK